MTRKTRPPEQLLSLTGVLEGDGETNEHILVPAPSPDRDRSVFGEDRVELQVEPEFDEGF